MELQWTDTDRANGAQMRRLIEESEYQTFKAVWPQRPYWSFFGNHAAIAAWQTVVVPRLYDCFITTAEEWWALAVTSAAAEYVGGELARCMAFHAAENSKYLINSTYQEGNFAYCMSAYDPAYLDVLARYATNADLKGEQYAGILAERAYRHGNEKLVSLAIDRLSFYDPQGLDFSNPVLEYNIALARYNRLRGREVDLDQLFDLIHEEGNDYQQRIFLHELSTFIPFNINVAHTIAQMWADIYGHRQPSTKSDTRS